MILKVNDTNDFNISMSLSVDWENKEILIYVKYWNKKTNKIDKFEYPANEFSEAIKKFSELEEKQI
ncbi:MAG: hypothetical protein IJA34_00645 [Lachnospiraceae bacterium]|nr:hypothetical protein [Lachnospiraceae bacterium]